MTVLVWRIGTDTPDYSADDLSGEGARRSGGRWNRRGTAMVYSSSSIALACLETIVHLAASDLPLNRYLVSLTVPDDIWREAVILQSGDHVGWEAGTHWAMNKTSVLLLVPSVIVPEELNILINPAHPETERIQATKMRRWTYDSCFRR